MLYPPYSSNFGAAAAGDGWPLSGSVEDSGSDALLPQRLARTANLWVGLRGRSSAACPEPLTPAT
jgi:hypothetical protein